MASPTSRAVAQCRDRPWKPARSSAAIDALNFGLNDDEPVVRGASAWALRQLDSEAAREFLDARLSIEDDPMVRDEILGMISDEF